jgi:hypothetical protein
VLISHPDRGRTKLSRVFLLVMLTLHRYPMKVFEQSA